jgi:hypothetical protein
MMDDQCAHRGRPMASEGPPRTEAILCVRVPYREGRERVGQAIEVLRKEQPLPQPRVPHPVRQPDTRPRRQAEEA